MDEFPVPQQVRGILQNAVDEAQRRSAATVAPEHLLLALTLESESAASFVLADFGLDHEAVDEALDTEAEQSLSVVGITDLDPALTTATRGLNRPGWSSAIREAFRRAQTASNRGRRRRAAELDVLYGVITANVGTVPRALAYAGVDRDALIGRVERERLAADDDQQRVAAHQGISAQDRQALRREAQRRMQDARRDAMHDAQDASREAQRDAQARRREAQRAAQDARRPAPDTDPTSD